jgi:hypothetical protein
MSDKRFRVAFSFAGEKRDFVEKVAGLLANRFGEAGILYDKYHQAEFSRGDLAFYLPDLYEREADLIVAVFSTDYENKEWCGLEWNAIFGLLKQRKAGEVMLARFGRVEGKGLRGLAGYTELDDLSPDQAADLILERLALNEGKPKDHYIASVRRAAPTERQGPRIYDDRVAAKLRSEVGKLLRFPDAFPDKTSPSVGILESMLVNQLPRRVFDLLMGYEERDVREVPGMGTKLQQHMNDYYAFRQEISRVEESVVIKIGKHTSCEFRAAWAILYRYSMMRFGGLAQNAIIAGGNFLNYGITWDEAERVYETLSQEPSVASAVSELFQAHKELCDGLGMLTELSAVSEG